MSRVFSLRARYIADEAIMKNRIKIVIHRFVIFVIVIVAVVVVIAVVNASRPFRCGKLMLCECMMFQCN